MKIPIEISVGDPDETLFGMVFARLFQSIEEAAHDARQKSAPTSVPFESIGLTMVSPQTFARLLEKAVNVLRDREVFGSAAKLQNRSALSGFGVVGRNPYRFDEEVVGEYDREPAGVFVDAGPRRTHLPERISLRRATRKVVAQHHGLCFRHRGFGLVLVGRTRQCQKLGHPTQNARLVP